MHDDFCLQSRKEQETSHNLYCDMVVNGRLLERLVAAQTYQVKSIVLGSVRMLRTTLTMDIYLVSLLPHSVSKSPIGLLAYSGKQNFAML